MVNPVINQTNIVAPRVPLIDERTGLISREWYRFFLNLFVLTGSGRNDVSLLDLQVGPPTQPLIDVDSLNPEPNGLAAYAAGSTQESQIAELQKQIQALALTTQSVDLSEVWKQLQALQVVPPSQLDALTTGAAILYGNGSGGFSNVTIGTGVSFTSGTLSATGTGGTVTAVTGTAPVSSSGGTTPDISMAAASTSADGYLTSTDWNTFNNKQNVAAPVVKTADFSVVNGDAWLINNKSGSTCTVTLPTASSWAGRVLHFQNYQSQTLVSASSNVTLVDGSATGTSILLASSGDSATLVSDGSNWLTTQYASNNNLLLE
jgi:hypothetical protein